MESAYLKYVYDRLHVLINHNSIKNPFRQWAPGAGGHMCRSTCLVFSIYCTSAYVIDHFPCNQYLYQIAQGLPSSRVIILVVGNFI